MKQPLPSDGGISDAGPVAGGAAVPGAVAAILDAANWLVPQPPCRIHRRSHAWTVGSGRPAARL